MTPSPDINGTLLLVTLIAIVVAVVAVKGGWNRPRQNPQPSGQDRWLAQENQRLRQNVSELQAEIRQLKAPKPRPTQEERAAREEAEQERMRKLHFDAVQWEDVRFFTKPVMSSRGEFTMFDVAYSITRQRKPEGKYPFYVFPQVNLGEIIGTSAEKTWRGNKAHQAINSKRGDLVLATRRGDPIAVFEYQGSGHYLSQDARTRDETKRIALKRAGLRYVPIPDGTCHSEMCHIIQNVLDDYLNARISNAERSHAR